MDKILLEPWNRFVKTIIRMTLVVSFLSTIIWFNVSAEAKPAEIRQLTPQADKIAPALQATLDALGPRDMVTVVVTLRDQADLSQIPGSSRAARLTGVVRALQARADASQRAIKTLLEVRQAQGLAGQVTSFWVFDGLSVTATQDVIQELAARSDVARITPDNIVIVPAQTGANPAPNLSAINAPAAWSLGLYGQGVVVANMDSGVDVSHPDLSGRWRGGSNSWFDPYGQHPTTPTDLSGHGTWTMGVMVGGEAGGTSIGVAPQAQWIAVKIFNDQGVSTASAIHQGFQWLLDPDGNPNTADAPQVVNNSWTYGSPGCNLEFQLDLQSLRAAGVLPVFAAGNFGPYGSTNVSPANYPEAFAIGAVDNADQIYAYSSRGPSACGEAQTVYPELVAPGVNVKTSDLYGFYTQATGTSLSAPHAAGALALLLSAYPNLTAYQQQAALTSGAVDLGAAGPDNTFGYGRLDVLASYQWLQAGGVNATPGPTPMPTAMPTATPTPAPTATPTTAPMATPTSIPAPTATPTAVPDTTLHIGDLDRSSKLSGSKWNATVTIYIHDASERLVSSAKVTGKWSNGATGTVSCTTNTGGVCQVSKTGLAARTTSVTFTVTNVTRATFTYNSPANHDPDGDSNGTVIAVPKP